MATPAAAGAATPTAANAKTDTPEPSYAEATSSLERLKAQAALSDLDGEQMECQDTDEGDDIIPHDTDTPTTRIEQDEDKGDWQTVLTIRQKKSLARAGRETAGAMGGYDSSSQPLGPLKKPPLKKKTQGVEILRARMLGESKTAVITFYGPMIPRFVYYMGGEIPCYPFKNTVQFCKAYIQTGHRTDMCPQPPTSVCNRCGTKEPEPEHECKRTCTTCGEEHLAGSTDCKKRFKKPQEIIIQKIQSFEQAISTKSTFVRHGRYERRRLATIKATGRPTSGIATARAIWIKRATKKTR
ncbi:hypothetical protein HPB49_008786 [Dermacentor silvarum]|uniref:Uncharacterized protein n=1 Tax=Dermacentor silvarum TaxID=543639 RepID=A0ACB8CW07_DERSI|nr:hypothetical protein HPB49_008786 [Dermacentor silvarum]